LPARWAARCSMRTTDMVESPTNRRFSWTPEWSTSKLILLLGPSSLRPGAAGVGMSPCPHGQGWGMGGLIAAEAVSQFPGPPLLDPPTSPPRSTTGVVGGARWDAWRTRCHDSGRREQRASRPPSPEPRRLCDRRATKRSDWRAGRAEASKPRRCTRHLQGNSHRAPKAGRGPWGVAGAPAGQGPARRRAGLNCIAAFGVRDRDSDPKG